MKKKFNLVDALLLLLLAAAVTACALFLRSRGTITTSASASSPMTFTLELREVKQEVIRQMQVGQKIYSSIDGTYLGVLQDVLTAPCTKLEYSQSAGQYFSYEIGDCRQVHLVIGGDGLESAREITINGNVIAVGASLSVKGKGYAGTGFVIAIDTGSSVPVDDNAIGSGDTEIVYTVEFSDIRTITANAFHVGDRIYDATTKGLMGTITDLSLEPYSEWQSDKDGQGVKVTKPERYCLIVTVTGRCTETENSYFLDGKVELKLNTGLAITTKYARSTLGYRSIISVGGAA